MRGAAQLAAQRKHQKQTRHLQQRHSHTRARFTLYPASPSLTRYHAAITMETKAPLSLDTAIKVAFSMEGRDKLTKVRAHPYHIDASVAGVAYIALCVACAIDSLVLSDLAS